MSRFIFLVIVAFLSGCRQDNSFSVARIINGNSIELVNGSIVVLENVEDKEENIRILKRYVTNRVQLYDTDDEELSSLPTGSVQAVVYNKDGDCLNDLLKAVTEITKDSVLPATTAGAPVANKTVISFVREEGVMKVRAAINGLDMYFVFDTGASMISISQDEADRLRSYGKLSEADILGKGKFSDANGDITEGTIVNLATVQIGDRTVSNVKACVMSGQNVPLLFGLTALEKFGKFTIDIPAGRIVLE